MSMQWNGKEWVIISPTKTSRTTNSILSGSRQTSNSSQQCQTKPADQFHPSAPQRRWEATNSNQYHHQNPALRASQYTRNNGSANIQHQNQNVNPALRATQHTRNNGSGNNQHQPSSFHSSTEEQLFWEEQMRQDIKYNEMMAQHQYQDLKYQDMMTQQELMNSYRSNGSRQTNSNRTYEQGLQKYNIKIPSKNASKHEESPTKPTEKSFHTNSPRSNNRYDTLDDIKDESDSSMGSLCDSSRGGEDSGDESQSSTKEKASVKPSFKEALEQRPRKTDTSTACRENSKQPPAKITEWEKAWIKAKSTKAMTNKQMNQFHKEANGIINGISMPNLYKINEALRLYKHNHKERMCNDLLKLLADSNSSIGFCYYKLGKICTDIKDVELYTEAYKALKHGMDAVTEDSEKFTLLYELLKVKALLPHDDREYLKITVPKKVSDDVFMALMKEKNDKTSSKAIENYILHCNLSMDFAKYSLEDYFSKCLSMKCIEKIIGSYTLVKIEMVKLALTKEYYGACAKLISVMLKDAATPQTSSIYFATELAVETGKKELLDKMFTMTETFKLDDCKQFEAALLYCCQGKSSTQKVDAVNTLMSFVKKTNIAINLENQIKTLGESDQRRQLICNPTFATISFIGNTTGGETKATGSKKKKKRKKRISEASSEGQLENADQKSAKVVYVPTIWEEIKLIIETIDFTIPNEDEDDEEEEFVDNEGEDDDEEIKFEDEEDDKFSDDEEDAKSMLHVRNLSAKDLSGGSAVDLGIDGMPWEVECTQDVWLFLRDKKTPVYLKEKLMVAIKMLASGNWRKRLSKPLQHLNSNIRLYQAKITKSCRLIWEMSIAFSARCSINKYDSNELDHAESCEKGSVYVDKIRVWNISLKSEDLQKMIEQIVFSHKRGQSCLIQKKLKGIKQEPMVVNHERLPNIYINESYTKEYLKQLTYQKSRLNLDDKKYLFFPPANPNDQEYNILKFYAFTTAMASRVLSLTKSQLDFPFQVSELEHTIIHLEPKNACAVLLLGRSGTGKTTCCLYRLYKHYQSYWDAAQHAGPHIPKFKYQLLDKMNQEALDMEESESEESYHSASEMIADEESDSEEEEYVLVPCLCDDDCNCLPIYAPLKLKNPARKSRRRQSTACSSKSESDAIEGPSTAGGFSSEIEPEVVEDVPGKEKEEEECQYEDLRQLLVTKNEVLCNEIKKNFSELCIGCPNGQYEPCDPKEYTDIKDIPPQKYPMFITTKDLLVLLDGSLDGNPFFDRDKNGSLLNDIVGWGKNKVHLSILPLEDEEEAELEGHEKGDEDGVEGEEGEKKRKVEKKEVASSTKVKEVTYDVFAHEIWPQISKTRHGGDCHPSLVWIEIKSFIKGSAESFLSEQGYLSKDEYLSIGKKKAPNFTGNREDIYSMFLLYRKVKISSRYFDEMDVHFNIYQRLKRILIPDWAFHQVYVDETQDFTQGELLLLLRCSLNQNAMFFSGDTAQSIINGVSFRFCDLKSLFLIAKEEFERNRMISPVVVPKRIHQLTHNYRSHSGILKLASSIVQLLELFFPESFDKLSPDVGLFDGPKPIILDTNDFADLGMLLQGSKRDTSAIEFGAHQVVLVQDDASKEGVPPELSCGLVLSIYEAKGLEFDDVLLFNFFKDSLAVDEWRVIASNIENIEEETSGTDFSLRITLEEQLECATRALDFDYNKHKLLNSELKKLYTAITRARVNVWIFDEDKKKRAPIFEMFLRKNLVKVMKLEDSSPEQRAFAERSSEADWRRQGFRFYEKCLWKLAMKCFESGKDVKMQEKCCAQMQGALAESLAREWKLKKTPKLLSCVHEEFRKAAKLFLKNQLFDEAKVCLRNLKAWKHLGKICERQNQFSTAASYYQMTSENMTDAIRCYKLAGKYKTAIRILKNSGCYLKCIELCIEYDSISTDTKDKNDAAIYKQYSAEAASKIFYENSQYEDMQIALKYLSYEEQYNFLKMRMNCERYLLQLYMDHGKTQLVVDHYKEKRLFFEAAQIETDVELKAGYLLMAVRQLHLVAKNREKEVPIITEITKMLTDGNCSLAVRNDLLFYKMQIMRDISNIQEIFLYYYNQKNVVMTLLTVYCWIKFSSKSIYDVIPGIGSLLKYIYPMSENVYDIILQLACEKEFENEEFILKIFGMHKDIFNSKMILHEDETKILYLMACSKSSTYLNIPPKNGTKMELSLARRRIKDVLIKILLELLSVVISQLESEVLYAMTLVHVESCSYEGCSKTHSYPTSTSFGTGINSFVSLLQLNALCQHYHEKYLSNGKMHKDYMNKLLEFAKHDTTVFKLGRFIIGYMSYLHVLDIEQYSNCLNRIPKSVRSLLFTFIRREWKTENDAKGFVDMNRYVLLSLFSYLLDRENPVAEELLMRSLTVINYHKSYNTLSDFYKYLSNLYIKKHIVNASYDVLRCITKTIRFQNPNLVTICELIEIPVIVMFLAVSKLTPTTVYLPDKMIEYKDFYNSIYSFNRESSIDMAVHRLADSRKGAIQEVLQKLVGILIGAGEHKFNLISVLHEQISSFKKGDYEKIQEQLVCERILIIYLVFLCNFPHWLKGGESIVHRFKHRSVEGQGQLARLFNRISNVNNPEQARDLLSGYLKFNKQTLVEYNFNQEWIKMTTAPTTKPEQKWTIKSREQLTAIGSSALDNNKTKSNSTTKVDSKYRECWDDVIENRKSGSVEDAAVSGEGFTVNDDNAKFGDGIENEDGDYEEDANETDDIQLKKRKETILRNIKATAIQEWWRCAAKRRVFITDMIENFKQYKHSVLFIQRWWRFTRKKPYRDHVEVDNEVSPSESLNHDVYFDSHGNCMACLLNVGPDMKEEHLKEGSNHFIYVEMYDKFKKVSTSFMELNELFEDRKDLLDEKNQNEFDLALSRISMKYNTGKQKKNWAVAPELEATIATLFTRINEAIGSAKHTPIENNDDDFEVVNHKKKNKSKAQPQPKKQKKKKR